MIVKISVFTCLFSLFTFAADQGAPAAAAKGTPPEGEKSPASTAPAADQSAAATEKKGDPASQKEKKIGENVTATATEIKFPGLTINRKTHEISMDATICLDSGLLEYLVCLPDTFEYESLLVTKAKPEILHTALLLVGMKPYPLRPGLEVFWWQKALKAKDSRVRLEVAWEGEDGRLERTNITSLVRNRVGNGEDDWVNGGGNTGDNETEEVSDAWVFTGSFVHTPKNGKPVYAANLGGIVVAIWPNPSAVIQYGKESGNPYRGDDMGMEVNDEYVPKKGTKVKLIVTQYTAPENEFLEK